MEGSVTNSGRKSVYRYGADFGLWMGLYLTLMSACFVFSVHVTGLLFFLLPLVLGLPVMLYVLLGRMYGSEPAYRKVSALWLCGIWTFIFGSLVCALFTGAWLVMVEPGFIDSYFRSAVDTIESSPMRAEYAEPVSTMKQALESGMLPSDMEFVFTMIWTTAFWGSIISLLTSIVLQRRKKFVRQ